MTTLRPDQADRQDHRHHRFALGALSTTPFDSHQDLRRCPTHHQSNGNNYRIAMLRPPYTHYDQLYVYNFDRIDLGLIDDPDLIGTWIEDDTAILFFHKEKKALIEKIRKRSDATILYEPDLPR